jgi:hypothetical protein
MHCAAAAARCACAIPARYSASASMLPYAVKLHLVEQNQTARFGTEAIQSISNAINLPEKLHTEVGRIYSARPGRPRKKLATSRAYIQSLPYGEQRTEGIQMVRDAMKTLAMRDSAIEQRLKALDEDFCPPGSSK